MYCGNLAGCLFVLTTNIIGLDPRMSKDLHEAGAHNVLLIVSVRDASSSNPSSSVGAEHGPRNGEEETQDNVQASEGDSLAAPVSAGGFVNEVQPLQVVAQQESTRSYFLAQTLESTKTVPVVSGNLPLDDVMFDGVTELVEESVSSEFDPDYPVSNEANAGEHSGDISLASTVIGSFVYRGITYVIEPGGDNVAVVAADPALFPDDFIEANAIVLPSRVSVNDIDFYSVTRIADGAFASIKDTEIITIPASIATIEDGAFVDAEFLQYIVVSSDNPNYSMYDGCLYDKPMTSLLLVPEGRTGAVCIAPSATTIDTEVFSHCPSVDELVVDAGSAAFSALEGVKIRDVDSELIEVATGTNEFVFDATYNEVIAVGVGDILEFPSAADAATVYASSNCSIGLENDEMLATQSGTTQIVEISKNSRKINVAVYNIVIYEDADTNNLFSGEGLNAFATEEKSAYQADSSSSTMKIMPGATLRTSTQPYYLVSESLAETTYSFEQASTYDLYQKGAPTTPWPWSWWGGTNDYVNRIFHYNGRLIAENNNGRYQAWGCSETGGIRAVQYSYTEDGAVKYDLPTGPYGLSLNATVYMFLIFDTESSSTMKIMPGATLRTSTQPYYLVSESLAVTTYSFEQASTYDLYQKDAPTTPWPWSWWDGTNDYVKRIFHYNERLIAESTAGYYQAWGCSETGGIRAVQYSYTEDGAVKYDLPTGPYGLSLNATVYMFFTEGSGPTKAITWNGNGGNWGSDVDIRKTVWMLPSTTATGPLIGEEYVMPTREGYRFYGWSASATAQPSEALESVVTPDHSTTYFAVWGVIKEVNLDQQKATVESATKTLYYVYGIPEFYADSGCQTLYIPSKVVPEKIGYTFEGYYSDAAGGVRYLTAQGAKTSDVTASLWNNEDAIATLYARWKAIDYEIVYNMSDGNYVAYFEEGAPANPVTYTYDENWIEGNPKPTVPLTSPKRAGYAFGGWKVTGEDSHIIYDSIYAIDRTLSENLTYTACWTPVLSVTLPVTTPVGFRIDVATGRTEDAVNGVSKTLMISSSTPEDTTLSLVCNASDDEPVEALFEDRESGAVTSLIDSLGFSYDLGESDYVTAAEKTLVFSRKAGTAGPLTVSGSQKYASANSKELKTLSIEGPFSLVQTDADGSTFVDLLIDLAKVHIRSEAELKEAGIVDEAHLADIVWTVSL